MVGGLIVVLTYLLASVDALSSTALLQHGSQFLLPLKIVPPYIFKHFLKSHVIAQLINNQHTPTRPPGDCPCLRFMIDDYVHVINVLLLLLLIIIITKELWDDRVKIPGARFSKNLRKNPKFSLSFS